MHTVWLKLREESIYLIFGKETVIKYFKVNSRHKILQRLFSPLDFLLHTKKIVRFWKKCPIFFMLQEKNTTQFSKYASKTD